eukprot:TRINITY_DN3168_c0_g2_i2.p1 TRINITY_DN3168_c0_g2~~TRINITY_DN3168_c0_g2_i2.p1  ORF type:complete len:475 (+),score=121.76 TRINITY_DN3168_c0_g2_i2:48-1472(+)
MSNTTVLENIAAVQRLGNAVRSSLGPGAKNKMIVRSSGEVVVTSDGARIISELWECLVATSARLSAEKEERDDRGGEEEDDPHAMAKKNKGIFRDDHLRREMAQIDPLAAFKATRRRSETASALLPSTSTFVNRQHQPVARMLVDASLRQKEEYGDGTTSVVVLCSELCSKASTLVKSGIHPLRISNAFRASRDIAIKLLREELSILINSRSGNSNDQNNPYTNALYVASTNAIKSSLSRVITPSSSSSSRRAPSLVGDEDEDQQLIDRISDVVMTALKRALPLDESKGVTAEITSMASEARSKDSSPLSSGSCAIAKPENEQWECFERQIQPLRKALRSNVVVEYIEGNNIRDTSLVDGIFLKHKGFASRLATDADLLVLDNVPVAVVSFSLDIPRLKSKHEVAAGSIEEYDKLNEYGRETERGIVKRFVEAGAKVVFCQWSIDPVVVQLMHDEGCCCCCCWSPDIFHFNQFD